MSAENRPVTLLDALLDRADERQRRRDDLDLQQLGDSIAVHGLAEHLLEEGDTQLYLLAANVAACIRSGQSFGNLDPEQIARLNRLTNGTEKVLNSLPLMPASGDLFSATPLSLPPNEKGESNVSLIDILKDNPKVWVERDGTSYLRLSRAMNYLLGTKEKDEAEKAAIRTYVFNQIKIWSKKEKMKDNL